MTDVFITAFYQEKEYTKKADTEWLKSARQDAQYWENSKDRQIID